MVQNSTNNVQGFSHLKSENVQIVHKRMLLGPWSVDKYDMVTDRLIASMYRYQLKFPYFGKKKQVEICKTLNLIQ